MTTMFAKDGPTFFELIHQALVSTRHGYDLLAPKFDLTPFRTPDAILEPAINALGPVDSALDICCGTGAAMRFLIPLCRREFVGIDFSEGMLEIAKKYLAPASSPAPNSAFSTHDLSPSTHDSSPSTQDSAPSTSFVHADVLEMSFDSQFDLAVCFGALGHFDIPDQRNFLRHVRKALKPGGRFAFITAPHPPRFSRVNLVLRAFNAIMRIRNTLLKPPFIMYYLTFLLPEVEALLKEEGFSVEIRADIFHAPYHRNCLVIATK
ncbi:MAG TPA: class I SAM-dependent methyltransferase [Planctomycetota bacterium]|nr:class I SAM-dependent methyltransferase [Planctomycetota bacterium]